MKKINAPKILILLGLFFLSLSSYAQVYARLEREPDSFHYYDNYYQHEVYDCYIRFYSDYDCTNPLTLSSNLTVNFHMDDYYYSNGYSSSSSLTTPIGVSAGESEVFLYDKYVLLVDYDESNPYSYIEYRSSLELRAGTGYIVVPPNY